MDDNETPGDSTGSAEQTRAFGRSLMESAQQIWLAGLGAFSKAQQEGGKFFDTLVEEGTRMQDKTRAYTQNQFEQVQRRTEPWMSEARKRTGDAFGRFEQMFDDRLARAMQRMRTPTREEFENLSMRVEELERELRASRPAGPPRQEPPVK